MLDIDELRDALSYVPDTGELVWKCAFGGRVKAGDGAGVSDGRYLRVGFKGKLYGAHRLAWAIFNGVEPNGEIDHINGNRADNRIKNLRVVSRSENMRNSPRRSDNSTGAVGVYRTKSGSFYAQSCHGGANVHLGTFKSLEEAKIARRKFQEMNGYHPNHGRESILEDAKAAAKSAAKTGK